jgi:opacity protein-like surface antigen
MLFLSLFGAAAALAQPIGIGVKAGVPLTDFFSTVKSSNFGFNSNTKNYILGPALELRLPLGLGIEADALYRHIGYAATSGSSAESVKGSSWEFPILGKFRLPGKAVRPFVDAGFTFNTLSGLTGSVLTVTGLQNASTSSTKTGKGFVAGAGLDIHVGVHLQPEVRYTHWGEARFMNPLNLVRGSQNQAEFLLGIGF